MSYHRESLDSLDLAPAIEKIVSATTERVGQAVSFGVLGRKLRDVIGQVKNVFHVDGFAITVQDCYAQKQADVTVDVLDVVIENYNYQPQRPPVVDVWELTRRSSEERKLVVAELKRQIGSAKDRQKPIDARIKELAKQLKKESDPQRKGELEENHASEQNHFESIDADIAALALKLEEEEKLLATELEGLKNGKPVEPIETNTAKSEFVSPMIVRVNL